MYVFFLSQDFEENIEQFGRGKPRLGGLSVEATEQRKAAAILDKHKQAVETRRRRKADRAWFTMKCVGSCET